MTTVRFRESVGGRVLFGVTAFALASAGVLALIGSGSHFFGYVSVVTLGCIVGCLAAVMHASDRHLEHALVLIVALPFVGGFYFAALNVVPGGGRALASALLLASLAPAWAAARPSRLRAPFRTPARSDPAARAAA